MFLELKFICNEVFWSANEFGFGDDFGVDDFFDKTNVVFQTHVHAFSTTTLTGFVFCMLKVESQNLQKVASQNSRKVVSQNLRKVANEKGGKMTKVARMWQRENSKVNSRRQREQRSERTHTACSQSFWFEVRISEEPAEVVEANSNKMHDTGAMTDGSKRRHEAVESNSDAESASSVIGSFSFISDTGDSRPLFSAVQSDCRQPTSGMRTGWMSPSTMKKSISMCHNLHGSRIHIIGPARFSRWVVLQRNPSPTMTLL